MSVVNEKPESDIQVNAEAILDRYLVHLRMHRTVTRKTVLRVFMSLPCSVSLMQLHEHVQKCDPSISYTTVYRSLMLFIRCGLAARVVCPDGVVRYESIRNRRNSNMLICTACGYSVEFQSHEVPMVALRMQNEFGFKVRQHKLHIFGLCEKC